MTHAVAPTVTSLPKGLVPVKRSGRQVLVALVGLCWIWLGLAGSVWYMWLLTPSFRNDLWWPHFNATGYQVLLIDVINDLLSTTLELPALVNVASVAIHRDYTGSVLTPLAHPAYATRLATHGLSSIAYVIPNLRNATATEALWLPTQYCYVDFERRWELAHTEARQRRCAATMVTNGAVYFEAILRNQDWNAIAVAAGAGFAPAIERGLTSSADGRKWMAATAAANTSVVDEIAFWRDHGIRFYELQWQTYYLPGLDQLLVIENALSIEQSVTLKSSTKRRGPWTTMNLNFFFINEIYTVGTACNMSLIRNTTSYFTSDYCFSYLTTDLEGVLFLSDDFGNFVAQTGLSHTFIGPFLSVDMWVLPPPPQLITLVAAITSALHDELETNGQFAFGFANLRAMSLQPLPLPWLTDANGKEYVYYGGNPMCLGGMARAYVQAPFTADAACELQQPLTINISPQALLFSLLASFGGTHNTFSSTFSTDDSSNNASSISSTVCDVQGVTSCASDIDVAIALLEQYPVSGFWASLVTNTSAAVAALNVSLMQYASDDDALQYSLLWLPILEPSWRFYGHVMLFDWVSGGREVVAFEGDAATLVLMSDLYDTATIEPSTATLSRATKTIYILLVYSSVLLGLLVVVTTMYAGMAKLRFLGLNLTYFHRVAGSTWLGRPLLFLRGASALILLGTAPIGVSSVHGAAALDLPSRSTYESMLLAWEALWITYVLQELLLPFNDKGIHSAGYFSSSVIWVVYVALDSVSPLYVETSLQHNCVGLAYSHLCTSVRIKLGSVVRVLWLFFLQGLVVPIAVLAAAYGHRRKLQRRQSRGVHGLMLSGAGFAFLATPDETDAPFDAIAGLFSGLLRLTYKRRQYTFDIKLWTIVRGQKQRPRNPSQLDGPSTSTIPELSPITPRPRWLGWVYSLGGMTYIGIAIAGSLSYLRLTETTLTNDLIWVGFDLRGDHPFLATWLLEALALGAENTTRPLSELNVAAAFNTTLASTISFADHDGAMLHYSELTSIANAIPALRSLPAMEVPWVFTGYCYVDFNRTFGVAHTAARQARCASYATNGAVYMESFIRNVVWSDWVNYWGEAFEISVTTALVSSAAGLAFMSQLGEPWAPIDGEVDYWRRHGITSYELQWQNFKSIGLINAYTIANAYGAAYPFTLQATAGATRFSKQTSHKMYWGLANDLHSVLNNDTDLGGKSFVRDTSLSRNGSLTSVYLQTGLLASPLSAGLSAIQLFLGPFGSIDMHYVPVPVDLRRAAGAAMAIVHTLRLTYGAAYAALPHPLYLNPVPFAWLKPTFFVLGGSVLCVPDTSPLIITGGLQPLFSFESSCSANTGRTIASIPSQDHLLFAAAYATITNISHVCLQMRTQAYACEPMLRNTLAFLAHANLSALQTAWAPRLANALSPLQIELLQVGRPKASAPMRIYHLPLLESPDFSFFANVLLYDWVLGNREVVRFTGDTTSITLIGDGLRPRVQATDASQLPTVFALYSHRAVQYVTYVMIALAATTALYAVVSRGHVEGLNLLELSRVGGIVWVGRPFIALRSITALCLLSTSRLELDYDGHNSAFLSQNAPWYSAGIAANEVTWLVGIVNDISIVFTQDLTMLYTIYNSLVVLVLAACITILMPIEPSVSVARECQIESLDWQVVCNSGQVAVGDWRRLLLLVGTVFVCNGACYWLVRLGCRRPVTVYTRPSLLLSGGARYLFEHGPWMHEGVYYMDRASAVLNGLLSIRYRGVLYIFDIKTWRLHRMTPPTHTTVVPPRLARGIPLPDA